MERWPSTPESNYRNNAEYRVLVDTFESLIHKAQYTPTELREAAVLAAIHYERCRIQPRFLISAVGIKGTGVIERDRG
jgi:hypothetical protein